MDYTRRDDWSCSASFARFQCTVFHWQEFHDVRHAYSFGSLYIMYKQDNLIIIKTSICMPAWKLSVLQSPKDTQFHSSRSITVVCRPSDVKQNDNIWHEATLHLIHAPQQLPRLMLSHWCLFFWPAHFSATSDVHAIVKQDGRQRYCLNSKMTQPTF